MYIVACWDSNELCVDVVLQEARLLHLKGYHALSCRVL